MDFGGPHDAGQVFGKRDNDFCGGHAVSRDANAEGLQLAPQILFDRGKIIRRKRRLFADFECRFPGRRQDCSDFMRQFPGRFIKRGGIRCQGRGQQEKNNQMPVIGALRAAARGTRSKQAQRPALGEMIAQARGAIGGLVGWRLVGILVGRTGFSLSVFGAGKS